MPKNNKENILKALLAILLSVYSFSSMAEWSLDNEQSSVSFVSVKKSTIAESHQFKKLSGSIVDHNASVAIDLTSVDTGIPIRDERMAKYLFNTTQFAQAKISASFQPSLLNNLKAGESREEKISVNVELHGKQKMVNFLVQIYKSNDKQLIVTSKKPSIINAADFGLDAGILKLAELAKLPSITQQVPVGFVLTFVR